MNNNDRNDRTLTRLLREIPARRAPATLELRVVNALQGGATGAARYGYKHWPLPARGACLALCIAFAVLTVYAEASLPSPALLIPPAWVDGAIVTAISLYSALFGLAALGYHTLYRPR